MNATKEIHFICRDTIIIYFIPFKYMYLLGYIYSTTQVNTFNYLTYYNKSINFSIILF